MYLQAWTKTADEYDAVPVTITSPDDGETRMTLTVNGRQSGEAIMGSNGEWYLISEDQVSHAHPLGSLDNVRGTGHVTPEWAVLAGLDLRR